jgi:hypothetical protein
MPNIKSIKYVPAAIVCLLLGVVQFVMALLIVETIAQGLGIEHAIKPRSKLAKFFYMGETARVPFLLASTIVLAPVTIAFAINEKFHAKHQKH